MRAVRTIRTVLDRFLEALVAIVMAVLVLDVSWQVFTRYVLKDPSTWTDELATFLIVWVAFLGAAVGLRRGAHLGMDYFVDRLPARRRAYVNVFIHVCTGLFSLSVMTIGGLILVVRKFHLQETSPALGLNLAWVYAALPISGLFLTMYSVELFVGAVRALSPRGSTAAGKPE
ncbi:MAG: TRAP transporter small permease [Phycisphaerae bacterium]|jgi:TRAP-type C4-dicarboxylate transport system permease small subunit